MTPFTLYLVIGALAVLAIALLLVLALTRGPITIASGGAKYLSAAGLFAILLLLVLLHYVDPSVLLALIIGALSTLGVHASSALGQPQINLPPGWQPPGYRATVVQPPPAQPPQA